MGSLFVASGINLFDSFDNLIIGVWGEAEKKVTKDFYQIIEIIL